MNIENKLLHDLLAEIVSNEKPESYLEIGVCEGGSLMAALDADRGHLKQITLCDTWLGEYGGTGKGSNEHIQILLNARFFGEVVWLNGDSKELIPTVPKSSVDLVLVDGDHSAEGCKADMENCWPILRRGGIMVVDDLCHPSHAYLQGVFDGFVEAVVPEVIRSTVIGVIRK